MKNQNKLTKKIKHWWNNQNRTFKYLIVSMSIVLFLSLCLIGTSQIYFDINSNYITSYECSAISIDYHLEHSNYSFWQNIFLEYKSIIGIMLILLCCSWLIHGFQVRLLA